MDKALYMKLLGCLGMMTHTCKDVEAGGPRIQGQPKPHSVTLSIPKVKRDYFRPHFIGSSFIIENSLAHALCDKGPFCNTVDNIREPCNTWTEAPVFKHWALNSQSCLGSCGASFLR